MCNSQSKQYSIWKLPISLKALSFLQDTFKWRCCWKPFQLAMHHAPQIYSWWCYRAQGHVKRHAFPSVEGNSPEVSKMWVLLCDYVQQHWSLLVEQQLAKKGAVVLSLDTILSWSHSMWFLPLFMDEEPAEWLSLEGYSTGANGSKTALQVHIQWLP